MRVVLALLLAAGLAGCGGGSADEAQPERTPSAPPAAAEADSLDDFRGEPVVVNVWSSW